VEEELLGFPIKTLISFLSEVSQADAREWQVTFGGFVQMFNWLCRYKFQRLVELLFVCICSFV